MTARQLIGLMAVVASLMLWGSGSTAGAAEITPLRNFAQLLEVAKQIGSAVTVFEQKPINDQKRRELAYLFARESKSAHCEVHYQKMAKLASDYKVKAHEFVEDTKGGANNWFKTVITFGGAIGAMKNIGKSDRQLSSITRRYENQANGKRQAVTHEDVDCDMLKFQIRILKEMVFVLHIDVGHLIYGETQILNRAIYEKLKADKYVSTTNFYDIHELKEGQKKLVLEYFASQVNPEKTTVGETVDHYLSLGSLIIGRLIDSCYSLGAYETIWLSLDTDRLRVCPKSRSDPNNNLFAAEFKIEAFKDTFDFCHRFLEAL